MKNKKNSHPDMGCERKFSVYVNFLRRHYPDQVKGTLRTQISATRRPCYYCQIIDLLNIIEIRDFIVNIFRDLKSEHI